MTGKFMMALIIDIAWLVLFAVVVVSFFKDKRKTDRLLKHEYEHDNAFREHVIGRMDPQGHYLVVVYWYDTKDFTHVCCYAKDGADAFMQGEHSANKVSGGTEKSNNRNKKFAIVNVQFLGQ